MLAPSSFTSAGYRAAELWYTPRALLATCLKRYSYEYEYLLVAVWHPRDSNSTSASRHVFAYEILSCWLLHQTLKAHALVRCQ